MSTNLDLSSTRAFLQAPVRIPVFAQEATRYSKGVWSSRLRLYPEGLFEVYFPVPTLEEQRTIALLKECRAAQIAAAVTGRIDPRENAA